MDRIDMLQVLIEHESGLTAQGVRAEMRGRYGATGRVRDTLDELVAEGLAAVAEDDEGRKVYVPVMPGAARAVKDRDCEGMEFDESFFG